MLMCLSLPALAHASEASIVAAIRLGRPLEQPGAAQALERGDTGAGRDLDRRAHGAPASPSGGQKS